MPYKKLYRNRQDANGDYQPRSWYVDDAESLSWVAEINPVATDAMPVEGLCGFIVRHKEDPNTLSHKYTIVVAEGLDDTAAYMERFVVIKELMHCYFVCDDQSATDSQIALETHMRQFFGHSATSPSLHVIAEYKALWMAMGVLCPEIRRQEYRVAYDNDELTLKQISDFLRAPEHIVQQLLTDQFDDEIRAILN